MHLSRPGRSPYRELVLVASLLACGICQASGQISIVPFTGIEGYWGSLTLQNVPAGVGEYSWHRGTDDRAENMIVSYKPPSKAWQSGPMSSGRENVSTTGDLLIMDSRLNDTGSYTVRVDLGSRTQTATGWLEIQEWESDPVISVNATSLVENGDPVAASCHTNATDASRIRWYVSALPVSSNDRITISPDGKTLVVHQPDRFDWSIQCAVQNVLGDLQKSDRLSLTVAYGPDSVRLRSTPSNIGGILSAEVGSQVHMDCAVLASRPQPTYRWIHKGSVLSSEANVSLPSLTWEQMGSYRCIVENPRTQISIYRDVRIRKPWTTPAIRTGFFLTGPLVVFFIVVTALAGVYLCGILVYTLITHFSTRTSRAI